MKYIPCKCYQTGNPLDGYEFDCEYEKAPSECDRCVCNFGNVNPITGKTWSSRRVTRYRSYLKRCIKR